MAASRISLSLTPAQLKELDRAITTIETILPELKAMEPLERRRLKTMGAKSENFCRETLNVMRQNPKLVNPALELDDAEADLRALDELRPRRQRLQQALERYVDTESLLGGDVMAAALEAYGLLKVSGKAQGLTSLRKDLGTRFKVSRRPRSGSGKDDTSGAA